MLPVYVDGDKRGAPNVAKPQLFYNDPGKSNIAGMRFDLPEVGGLSFSEHKGDKAKKAAEWTKKRNECVKFSFDYIGETLVALLTKG